MLVRNANDSYPLWHDPICLRIVGVAAAQEQFLRERLTQIFTQAGAAQGAPGCQANFHLIGSAHSAALIDAWINRNDHAGAAAPGWRRQARRLAVPRPVRVWYDVYVVNADGTPLGSACLGQSIGSEVPVSCDATATRLAFNQLARFDSLVMIVDLEQVADFGLAQLADYIGFVGLTRVNLDAPLQGEPTVLSLFRVAREDRPAGLTDWDRAFLSALYHTNPAVQGQEADIARSMAVTLVH